MTMSRSSTPRQLREGLAAHKRSRKNPIAQARSYLYSRHPTGFGISPARFAAASQETGSSFDDLMRWISRLYAGGQQQSTFRQEDISHAAQGATS